MGFSASNQEVQISGGENRELTASLNIAGIAETIYVTAESDEYQATNSTTGTRLELPRLELPQSVSVVPLQIFTDRQIVRLKEAADNVSGVRPLTSYDRMPGNEYLIRGSVTFAGFEERCFLRF